MSDIALLDYEKAEIRMTALPGRYGEFRLKACAKEPWTVAWIEGMPPGSVLWDVGANVGSYTLIAAKLGHLVVAVEPAYPNYATLCQNVALNGLGEQVIPVPLCLAPVVGWAAFPYRELWPGAASHGANGKEPVFVQRIPCATLDHLIHAFGLPFPTHVKLDVDGSEQDVLTGMVEMLRRDEPVSFLVEMQPGTVDGVTSWLVTQGCKLEERIEARGIYYGRFART